MIFEKGERICTERTTSEHFLKRAKILAFFTKEKALTKCKCFFWNSAATYSPGPCPAKYHLRRKA